MTRLRDVERRLNDLEGERRDDDEENVQAAMWDALVSFYTGD